MGTCEYVLVRDIEGSFSVTVQNVPCGTTGVTCTKSLTIEVDGNHVELVQGSHLIVNNQTYTPDTIHRVSNVNVTRTTVFTVLHYSFGMTIFWDSGTMNPSMKCWQQLSDFTLQFIINIFRTACYLARTSKSLNKTICIHYQSQRPIKCIFSMNMLMLYILTVPFLVKMSLLWKTKSCTWD